MHHNCGVWEVQDHDIYWEPSRLTGQLNIWQHISRESSSPLYKKKSCLWTEQSSSKCLACVLFPNDSTFQPDCQGHSSFISCFVLFCYSVWLTDRSWFRNIIEILKQTYIFCLLTPPLSTWLCLLWSIISNFSRFE